MITEPAMAMAIAIARKLSSAFGFALALSGAACGGDEAPKLSEVQTRVFKVSCASSETCHVGPSAAGGLNLESPSHAKMVNVASMQATTKKLVVPGKPDESFLMDKLLNRNLPLGPDMTWQPMPQVGFPLDSARIELVRAWIAAGAKND